MLQEVTASGEDLRCPYCDEPVRLASNLIVGRCEHLVLVQSNHDGSSTACFKASDEFFVFDTTGPRTVGVYVKTDDPRYARAFEAGYTEPHWPPPIR